MDEKQHELFGKMRRFPKYDMTFNEQQRLLANIKREIAHAERQKKRTSIIISMAAALFVLFFPIYIFTQTNIEFQQKEKAQDWTLSPTFDLLNKDGSVVYHNAVRGVKGKIGFLENGMKIVAGDQESVAKMFWYVWGKEQQLIGKTLRATATHKETGESFLLNETTLQAPLYGENASALTSFQPFPKEGIWKLDIHIDGKYFASIVIDVLPEYIQTKQATFYLTSDELYTGLKQNIMLKVDGKRQEDKLTVKAVYNRTHQLSFTYKKSAVYYTTSRQPVTLYEGKLTLDRAGEWKITVLNETVKVHVKK
jgi:hypothetical protein